MQNSTYYTSPLGRIMLMSNGRSLTGLWFVGQKYFAATSSDKVIEKNDLPVFEKTRSWLDRYFKGDKPQISELILEPQGSSFRQIVWEILCEIPYGEVVTYGSIAQRIAKQLGKKTMSAQAIGGAIGHNPISIIIPCHRVIGTNGSLTGYAGGVDKKLKLLEHEGASGFIK